ncbi:MAG: hypothetical protein NTX14_03975 [Candidatus Nealsonbacteria bacterium]|nr:hypothetical protein [Candidatus Nealsonbacteria bacterium]
MVAKNDVSDLIRFALTTLFIVLFFVGVGLVAVVLVEKQASKVNVADISKAVGIKPKAAAKEPLTMHFVKN